MADGDLFILVTVDVTQPSGAVPSVKPAGAVAQPRPKGATPQ